MRPSAPAHSAIQTSPGIPKAPMAGSPPACRCRMPPPSRVPASRPIAADKSGVASRLGRIGVHRGLDRAAEIKQPLFDQDGHVADIGCGLPPILEYAGLPRQLVHKRVVLCLIGVWLVLHVAQLLGFLAYLLGHRLLLA